MKCARQIDARPAGHRPVGLRLADTAHRQRPAGQCVAAEAAQIGQVERRRVAAADRRREAIAAERTAAGIDRAGDRPSSESDEVIAIAERRAAEAAAVDRQRVGVVAAQQSPVQRTTGGDIDRARRGGRDVAVDGCAARDVQRCQAVSEGNAIAHAAAGNLSAIGQIEGACTGKGQRSGRHRQLVIGGIDRSDVGDRRQCAGQRDGVRQDDRVAARAGVGGIDRRDQAGFVSDVIGCCCSGASDERG